MLSRISDCTILELGLVFLSPYGRESCSTESRTLTGGHQHCLYAPHVRAIRELPVSIVVSFVLAGGLFGNHNMPRKSHAIPVILLCVATTTRALFPTCVFFRSYNLKVKSQNFTGGAIS